MPEFLGLRLLANICLQLCLDFLASILSLVLIHCTFNDFLILYRDSCTLLFFDSVVNLYRRYRNRLALK